MAKKLIELPVQKHEIALPNEACSTCDLHRESHRPFFSPVRQSIKDAQGDDTNRILILTDFPDWRDQGSAKQAGPAGYYHRGFVQFEREILKGLECSWTYTSAVRCPVDPRKSKPKPKQYNACEEAFLRELVMTEKPRAVICLGKEALNSMCRIAGLLPPKSVNDVKGSYIISEALNLRIYSAEHQSAYVQRDTNIDALEKHYYEIFSKAEAYVLDTEYREKIKYTMARTPQDVAKLAAARMDRNEFAVDVETNYPLRDRKGSKDWKRNSVYKENSRCISLSVTYYDARLKEYINTVIVEEGLKDPVVLRRLFEDKVAILHNGSFDSNAIEALLDVDIFDFKRGVRDWQDTRLAFYLSDQNRLFTALKELARHYIPGVGDWEDEGDALVTQANMKVAEERDRLKKAIEVLKKDLEKFRVYDKGRGQVLVKAEKAAWTRAYKHIAEKNYESEIQIVRLMQTHKDRLRKLPQPGLCSFEDIPITKLCEYNAEDTLRTLQLWREVIPNLEKIDGFTYDRDCYEMMKEMIRTACYVQREGFNVNKDKLEKLEEKLLGREEEIRQELLQHENVVKAVEAVKGYQDAIRRNIEPVWTKVISVKNETFMGTLAKSYGVFHLGNRTECKVTFGKLVLPGIKKHFEEKKGLDSPEYRVFELLEELRESMDTRSKFLTSWKTWLCPDSKFHANYKLIANQNIGYARGKDAAGGAQSGRAGCSAPNLQQITKDEMLREIFDAPPGFFIAECDYKSLEPMLMAFVTGCDRLKQVFWRSLDIYRVTCNDMYQKGVDLSLPDDVVRKLLADPNTVSDKERKKFKTGFLAWVYGAGKFRLAATLNVSEEEAEDFIKRAEQTYYEIFEWKNSIRDIIREGGAVYTYTGRRRTFPISPRQDYSEEERIRYSKDFSTAFRVSVNYPIQSLGSDICLVQAAKVRRWIEKNNYFDVVKMVNLVHDSIYFYIKETHAHLLLEIIRIMEDVSHFKFKIDVPLTVEYTLGYNYAESMGLDHQKENQDRLKRKFGYIKEEAA